MIEYFLFVGLLAIGLLVWAAVALHEEGGSEPRERR